MKHQAAGPNLRMTVFMTQYSHPTRPLPWDDPSNGQPAAAWPAGLHQPAAAIAKARVEDIGTETKRRTELGVLGEFAAATTVGAARTESAGRMWIVLLA